MDAILDLINNAEIADAHTEIEHTEIKTPKPEQERHYWKCSDCLRPFVVEGKEKPEVCSCGGTPYYMGKVMGKNYYGHTEMTCECNEVCACATGPNCSCACGGMNHGKGLTVELQVIDGKMAVATTNAKHDQQATEYRQALEIAQKKYDKRFADTLAKLKVGTWIDHAEYCACRDATEKLRKIKGSKVHRSRMASLSVYLKEVQVDVPKLETPKHTLF